MSIIIKPIITEKATLQTEKQGAYTFAISSKANKIQVKEAVETTYGVTVLGVRTLNYGPKRSTRYTKKGIQHAQTNAMKKAIVTIKEGETIDYYSNN